MSERAWAVLAHDGGERAIREVFVSERAWAVLAHDGGERAIMESL
jgi:hypothetical protein